jgi:Zn-dependent protease with chaperone function
MPLPRDSTLQNELSGPLVQLPRRDLPLYALLIATWLLGFLAVFGPEFKEQFFMWHRELLSMLFPLIFLAGTALVYCSQMWSLAHPLVQSKDGSRRRIPQASAAPEVVAAILARAKKYGIPETIHCFRHPGLEGVNAYVWFNRGRTCLSITSGLEVLYGEGFLGDQAAVDQFYTLVDHELGHLWNRDTSILLMARSVLLACLLLLPIKLILLLSWNWRFTLADFARSFPRVTEGNEVVALFSFPSFFLFGAIFIGYTLGMLAILFVTYFSLRRRREFLADRFAAVVSDDIERSVVAMRWLLITNMPSRAPVASFAGAFGTHPSTESRLKSFRSARSPTSVGYELLLTTTLFLILGRALLSDYVFGAAWVERIEAPQVAVALLNAATISVLISLPLADVAGERFRIRLRVLGALLLWAMVGAFTLIAFDALLRALLPKPLDYASALIDQWEVFDWALYALSLPVTVAAFGFFHVLLLRTRQRPLFRRTIEQILAMVLGIFSLVALTKALSLPLSQVRTRRADAVELAIYDLAIVAANCADSHPNDEERQRCLEARDEDVERYKIVSSEFVHYRFSPPLVWIALWQHPFARPARYVL